MSTIRVNAKKLHELCVQLLLKAGSSSDEAEKVSSNLVLSNLKGHDSHGVGYLPRYLRTAKAGKLKLNVVPAVEKAGAIVRVDGQVGFGQVNGIAAMEAGIEAAKEHGVAIVTLKNSHHLGRIGCWAEMAVAENLCSIHMTNVAGHPPNTAPHNGGDARMGTNPFTVGCIGGSDAADAGGSESSYTGPIVLDFATSAMAAGKVREYLGRGEPTPEKVLLDKDGLPTTDGKALFPTSVSKAEHADVGCLLPFADHKGYALAFMCEIFGGVFSGGNSIHPDYERDPGLILNSMTVVVFDPVKVSGNDSAHLQNEIGKLREYMKESPLRKDPSGEKSAEKILIPGEVEHAAWAERIENGIPLSMGTYEDLLSVGEEILQMDRKTSMEILGTAACGDVLPVRQ